MIVCDKCKNEVTPDILAFKGKFFERFDIGELSLCEDCTVDFCIIVSKWLDREIKEAPPILRDTTIANKKVIVKKNEEGVNNKK